MKHAKLILVIGIIAITCQLLPLIAGAGADPQNETSNATQNDKQNEISNDTQNNTSNAAQNETQQETSETASESKADAVSICVIDSGCNTPNAQGRNYLTKSANSNTATATETSQNSDESQKTDNLSDSSQSAETDQLSNSAQRSQTDRISDSTKNSEANEVFDSAQDLTDSTGHGTAVYQILSDTAPDAQIYMLKCFENFEELSSNDEEEKSDSDIEAAIIQAIYDAVDVYNADIINMSWTLNTESEDLHEAIQYAADHGVILVAAAGNLSLSTPLGSIVYPAGWDEVIGVAGTDIDENGEPVTSTWYLHSEAVFISADGNYNNEKGSSYAAPRVTGLLANYLSEQKKASHTADESNQPDSSHTSEKSDQPNSSSAMEDTKYTSTQTDTSAILEDAKSYLKSIAIDAGDPGYDTTFGWGVVGITHR